MKAPDVQGLLLYVRFYYLDDDPPCIDKDMSEAPLL